MSFKRRSDSLDRIYDLADKVRSRALREIKRIRDVGTEWNEDEASMRAKQQRVLQDVEEALGEEDRKEVQKLANRAETLIAINNAVSSPPESQATAKAGETSPGSILLGSADNASPPESSASDDASSTSRLIPPNGDSDDDPSNSTHPRTNTSSARSKTPVALESARPPPEPQSKTQTAGLNVGPEAQAAEPEKAASPRALAEARLSLSETTLWPDLSQLRSALADSGFDYSQTFPMPTSQELTVSPPQLVFQCTSPNCASRLVVDLQESGTYKLQSARSKLDHDHSEEVVESSAAGTNEEGRPFPSTRSPSPIVPAKRSFDEIEEAEETQEMEEASGSKRTSLPSHDAEKGVCPEDSGEDSALDDVESGRIVGGSTRSSAPPPDLGPVPLIKGSDDDYHRSTSPRQHSPVAVAASPRSALLDFLQNLDSTGAYDFSNYYSVLQHGGIATPQQLKLVVSRETRLEKLMQTLEKHDEEEWREQSLGRPGGEEVKLSSTIQYAVWRREVFKDLLTGEQ